MTATIHQVERDHPLQLLSLRRHRPHGAGRAGAAVACLLSELPHRSVLPADCATERRRLFVCLQRSGVLVGVRQLAAAGVGHDDDRSAARRRPRIPDRAHRRTGPRLARTGDPDSDFYLGGRAGLRLRRGTRPGRHFFHIRAGPARLRALEPLFVALTDCDRRVHPCAARLPLYRGGVARARQRRRRGGAHDGRPSAAGRDRRQPADGAPRDHVRRRTGLLPRLRAVRPAARAGRPAERAGAGDLSLQAHQQARRAVLPAHGGRGRDHRRNHGAARVHAAAAAATIAALRLGARQGTARGTAQTRRLALAGLHRHRAVVHDHRHRAAVRHHAALVRRDLGRRRCAVGSPHARSLP